MLKGDLKRLAPGDGLVTALAVGAVAVIAAMTAWRSGAGGVYDTDLWWILATGREIAESGIPAENPWSLDSGQGIVVQQWLHCLLVWGVYSLAGMPGLAAMVLVFAAAAAAALAVLAMSYAGIGRERASRHRGALALVLAAGAFYLVRAYVGVRPHIWSLLAYCAVFLLCLRWRETGRARFLTPLPVVAILHANLHSSMLLADGAIFAALAVAAALEHRGGVEFARKWVLEPLAALACSAAGALVNPYGLAGVLYMPLSLGSASYNGVIQEMKPLVDASSPWLFAMLAVPCLVAVALARRSMRLAGGRRPYWLALAALFVVAAVGYAASIRNVWVFGLFFLAFASWTLRDGAADTLAPDAGSRRVAVAFGSALLAAAVFLGILGVASAPAAIEQAVTEAGYCAPVRVAEWAEGVSESAYGSDGLPVWCGFVFGGEFEYLAPSARVSVDPRPELWEPSITGLDRHSYRDYIDARSGDVAAIERSLAGCDVACVFDIGVEFESGDGSMASYLESGASGWTEVDGGFDAGFRVFTRDGSAAAACTR